MEQMENRYMKHFFAGIGEIHFLSFLVYPITSPIIGLVDMLRYNKNDKI